MKKFRINNEAVIELPIGRCDYRLLHRLERFTYAPWTTPTHIAELIDEYYVTASEFMDPANDLRIPEYPWGESLPWFGEVWGENTCYIRYYRFVFYLMGVYKELGLYDAKIMDRYSIESTTPSFKDWSYKATYRFIEGVDVSKHSWHTGSLDSYVKNFLMRGKHAES